MDNARIHWNDELRSMCKEAHVELAYLPPYSPDLNPIETSFAVLKVWIRANYEIAREYEDILNLGGFGCFLKLAIDV